MTAIGLSTSGGIIGADLLPAPLGHIGAELPQGAAFRAIVAIAYFNGHKSAAPLLVLATWAAIGLGLVALRHHRDSRKSGSAQVVAVAVPALATA